VRIKFWGVRGSIPCPGPDTIRYGGNTVCIEMRVEPNQRLIIIDAGSGIRELGNRLMADPQSKASISAEIFLTHTHWDHILGFPFFAPIYVPTTHLTIYGPVTYEDSSLKDVLDGQWAYRYFPVRPEELSSDIAYVDLIEGQYNLGQGLYLTTKYLNHPLLCLGYRFQYKDKVVCTAYDTEPFTNLFVTNSSDPAFDSAMAEEGEQVAAQENQRVEEFIRGADLLIYDAQYTISEYQEGRKGWGHSPVEHVIDVALRNNVKRLALFHHDIQRTDDQMDGIAKQNNLANLPGMEAFFAREGMEITL
jgi:phosphoribosyl 1,2-cyclic phosphodiesterase